MTTKTSFENSIRARFRLVALALVLWATFPAVTHAQLTNISYTTQSDGNGGLVITGFSASGSGPLTIPSTINNLPVTTIGGNGTGVGGFENNSNLTSVTIPDSVTTIGLDAFADCANLTSVNIGKGVVSIGGVDMEEGDDAFGGCYNLTSFTVSAQNPAYSSLNGVLFNKNQTTLIHYPLGVSGGYVVPNGVTRIGNNAFGLANNLTSITIPNGVTNIGYQSFLGCDGLRSITIPATVTSIGEAAFAQSFNLTSITVAAQNSAYSSLNGVLFDKNQTTLIQYPAGSYGSAYTIPNGVTSIGVLAFSECSLPGVTIPNSVTSIGGQAFMYCGGLTSITIPSSVSNIGLYAFDDCSRLTSAIFMGNAPTTGYSLFAQDASGFTVSYYNGAIGFTSPTWTDDGGDTYPAVDLGNLSDAFGGTVTSTANVKYSSWYGYYNYSAYPTVYEFNLGYQYVFPAGAGVYLYDYKSGHFWYTQSNYFPFVYDFSLGTFLYYYEGNGNPRYFYDYATNKVISE